MLTMRNVRDSEDCRKAGQLGKEFFEVVSSQTLTPAESSFCKKVINASENYIDSMQSLQLRKKSRAERALSSCPPPAAHLQETAVLGRMNQFIDTWRDIFESQQGEREFKLVVVGHSDNVMDTYPEAPLDNPERDVVHVSLSMGLK